MDLMKNEVTRRAVERLFRSSHGNLNITALTFVSRRTFYHNIFKRRVEIITARSDGFNHLTMSTWTDKETYLVRFIDVPADDLTTDRRFRISFHRC